MAGRRLGGRLLRAGLLTAAAFLGWFLLGSTTAHADELAPVKKAAAAAAPVTSAQPASRLMTASSTPPPAVPSAVKPGSAQARTVTSAAKAAAAPVRTQGVAARRVAPPLGSVFPVAHSASTSVHQAAATTRSAAQATAGSVSRTLKPVSTVSRAVEPLTSKVTSVVRTTTPVGTPKAATGTVSAVKGTAAGTVKGVVKATPLAAPSSIPVPPPGTVRPAQTGTGGPLAAAVPQPPALAEEVLLGGARADGTGADLTGASARVMPSAGPLATITPFTLATRGAVSVAAAAADALVTSPPPSPGMPSPFGAPGAGWASSSATALSGGFAGGVAAVLGSALILPLARFRAAFPRSWAMPRSLAGRPCFSPD